jgi:WD40 repeat protein
MGERVIPQLVWSPYGSAITVAALGDSCPRFVDVRTSEERMRLGQPGQCYSPASLLFLPDRKTMAVQTQSGGLELVRFPDGVLDPDNQWIATRGGYEPCYCDNPQDQPDHPLTVWDLAQGDMQARLDRAINSLAQHHRLDAAFDGDHILMFYESGEITSWAFNDPQAQEVLVSHVPSQPVSAWTLAWSGDGSHLAFTGSYGGVDVYQTETGQLVQRFDPPLESPALSPDGRLVALFDPDEKLQSVYEVQSGQRLLALPASPVLMGAAFPPDGRYLAYGDKSRASILELGSGKVTTLDPAPTAPVTDDMSLTRLIWAAKRASPSHSIYSSQPRFWRTRSSRLVAAHGKWPV